MTALIALFVGKGVGMLVALPVVAVVLAVRVSRDPWARRGVVAAIKRGR